MNAYSELKDFVEFWRSANDFEVHANGNCDFPGRVAYKTIFETVVDTTTVRLIRNGYNDGKVHLDETDILSAVRFHLDFSPDFQGYQFRKSDGAFVISGESEKMGGEYSVTLYPAA
ncbi:hypothetical protein [Burkholderia glumae]|uniref:hypothetical protein n=1 Tax=Burkholderia glumae TaxID=337 RepID=UPI003B9A9A2C